jgi:hypothetical protein
MESLERFLVVCTKIARRCYLQGYGLLIISCERRQRNLGEWFYKATLYGVCYSVNVTPEALKNYIDRHRQTESNTAKDPFAKIEESVLRILQDPGFGYVIVQITPNPSNGKIRLRILPVESYVFTLPRSTAKQELSVKSS